MGVLLRWREEVEVGSQAVGLAKQVAYVLTSFAPSNPIEALVCSTASCGDRNVPSARHLSHHPTGCNTSRPIKLDSHKAATKKVQER